MARTKQSFFERLTGSVRVADDDAPGIPATRGRQAGKNLKVTAEGDNNNEEWTDDEEGQLTLDVFQTSDEIIVQAFIAGVRLEDLDVSVTQDMLTLRGKREQSQEISKDNYYYQELYWGSFSRSVLLPQEVDVDAAQATLKNGLLTIRLKKLDRERVQKLRVKHE